MTAKTTTTKCQGGAKLDAKMFSKQNIRNVVKRKRKRGHGVKENTWRDRRRRSSLTNVTDQINYPPTLTSTKLQRKLAVIKI